MRHLKPVALAELATALGASLKGDPQCLVSRISVLEKAQKNDLSFLTQANYKKYLSSTQASAVILNAEDAKSCPPSCAMLIMENPRLGLVKAAEFFASRQECGGYSKTENNLKVEETQSQEDSLAKRIHPKNSNVHETVIIGEGCQIPKSSSIGPYTVLGNNVILAENVKIGAGCSIGDNSSIGCGSELKARVTLYHQITLGEGCLIHSGVVIGADGFGYVREQDTWYKMPHLGGVVLGDFVEVGANTTIDRGAIEDTIIGSKVIIDNLVQIGHNVHIGERTAIAACTAIAGSTHIGKDCLIGGAACISGHLEIGDKVYITATTGVNHSIRLPGVYSAGMPARPNQQWRKNIARFNHLDEIAKRLRIVENHLDIKTKLVSEVE